MKYAEKKGNVTRSSMIEYHIQCAATDCYNNDAAHEANKRAAIKTFRELGWRIRDGKWVCRIHSGRPAPTHTEEA